MRTLTRYLLTASLTAALAATASAQGGGGGGGGQGGGVNAQGTGDVGGLPFGANGNVGIQAAQMQTVSNSVTSAQMNVLGGFYANPYFQGKIGTYGNTSPGGFGQALYSTGTTGGMTGASGARTSTTGFGGSNGATGGRGTGAGGGGATSTGFGGTTAATGFGTQTGARTGGAGGFGGATTGAGGFGQTGGIAGGQTGRGTQFGGQTGRGGQMGGTQATNVIAADRSYNTFMRAAPNMASAFNSGNADVTPMSVRAQTELRGIFDRSTTISAGKSLEIQVTTDGIARLRGTVTNDDEKRMAIGLAQTTPGIRQVVSELKVQNP